MTPTYAVSGEAYELVTQVKFIALQYPSKEWGYNLRANGEYILCGGYHHKMRCRVCSVE